MFLEKIQLPLPGLKPIVARSSLGLLQCHLAACPLLRMTEYYHFLIIDRIDAGTCELQ